MTARVSAVVMAALLLLYLVMVAQLAMRLIAVDAPIAKGLGIALIVLPLLGLWAMIAELRFGLRSERLARSLGPEGDRLSALPRRASGRIDRSAALAAFPQYQADVESSPESWQAWYRLGMAYDACGDRKRARHAIRQSIALERAEAR